MATITFDTHEFVKKMTAVGMPIEQAEVLADSQKRLINEQLTTKQDLKSLKDELLLAIGGMLAGATGLIIAVMQLK